MSGHHIVQPATYIKVLSVLLVLMVATILAARIDLGGHLPNLIVALTIAVMKMTMIMLFFMHVKYSSGLARVIVASGLFWLMIMFVLTFSDYLSRGWHAPIFVAN